MPFKKERYPVDWKEIRVRILQRDGNRCKFCRAPNGAWISRDKDHGPIGAYMEADGRVTSNAGTPMGFARGSEWEGDKAVKVVLTISHLCHNPKCKNAQHLSALCSRCHLEYDRRLHLARSAQTRRRRILARQTGALFEDIAETEDAAEGISRDARGTLDSPCEV
jgi:hypothetical protein